LRTAHLTNGSDSYGDLVGRLVPLALLYREGGDLDHAESSLRRARDIAATHGFEFEHQDLLDEVQRESDAGGTRG
jgi:hypothetical protein